MHRRRLFLLGMIVIPPGQLTCIRLVQEYCGFAWLKFAIRYWNTFLNKCGNVIHHFNAHFSLGFFASDLLLAVYFFFLD